MENEALEGEAPTRGPNQCRHRGAAEVDDDASRAGEITQGRAGGELALQIGDCAVPRERLRDNRLPRLQRGDRDLDGKAISIILDQIVPETPLAKRLDRLEDDRGESR